jgi:hypothetical protein
LVIDVSRLFESQETAGTTKRAGIYDFVSAMLWLAIFVVGLSGQPSRER